ncbi:maleate cis-trans isomerase [Streptosporangium sp. NPDC051022]|uniref:maleate cis-trans isomerase family protein n=1 Tax=Streptosporangium sp. NPDC051022 TaxID=3155752 RepID=UPI00343F79DB
MSGMRARLGLILMSTNPVVEPELNRVLPADVSLHVTRIRFTDSTPEQYEALLPEVPAAASLLGDVRPDAIAFGCTSGSMYGGRGYDRKIVDLIRSAVDVPATTTTTALLRQFQRIGASSVSVATPYLDWVNDFEERYLVDAGITVSAIAGLNLSGDDVHRVTPEQLYRFARDTYVPGSDCLFISCMGLRTLDIIAHLEHDLGVPVITSPMATLLHLLELARVRVEPSDGSLYRGLLAAGGR